MLKNATILIPSKESSTEVCDFLWQTAKVLSVHNHVYVIDYRGARSLKEILLAFFTKRKFMFSTRRSNVTYLKPIYLIPFRRIKLISKLNMSFYFVSIQIILAIRHINSKQRIIWMFFPFLSHILIAKTFFWKTLYDIIDFYSFPNPQNQKKIIQQKRFLLKKADYVFAISHTLQQKYSLLTNKPIVLTPQGFSYTQLLSSHRESTTRKIPQNKPIIGFVGQISQRLDFELLNGLLKKNPQWNFVFVGPVNYEERMFKRKKQVRLNALFDYQNSFWIDQQPKNTIAAMIGQFDICMIPYNISLDFNRYCYPMKLFEYFYMKKPVISTPIKELKQPRFNHLVMIGNTAGEWRKHIKQLLSQPWPKKYRQQQRSLAIENSWQSKIEVIFSKLNCLN